MVKDIFSRRKTVLAPASAMTQSAPAPAPTPTPTPSPSPDSALKIAPARVTMNLPARVSAAPPPGAASEKKADAKGDPLPAPPGDGPSFSLSPAKGPAGPVALGGRGGGGGGGIPAAGSRSGAGGGSSGNDYFPVQDEEQPCEVCPACLARKASEAMFGRICAKLSANKRKRLSASGLTDAQKILPKREKNSA